MGLSLLSVAPTFAAGGSSFVSLHQQPLRIALPPVGIEYPSINPRGFKEQYAPTGATGCAIGITNTGCAFPGSGSLAFPEFTGYLLQAREFKFYIPAGAKYVMFGGYLPQRVNAAFALRFEAEPTRRADLSAGEYAQAQMNERIGDAFANLVKNKQELIVVHDGGGSLRFIGSGLDHTNTPLERGGWLYVRQIGGSSVLYDIQAGIDVDKAKYVAAYNKMIWNGSDPSDTNSNDGVAPTNPTTPTNPTNPTNPTTPTNPTNPTNPTTPTNPTNPTNPTDPTTPTKPHVKWVAPGETLNSDQAWEYLNLNADVMAAYKNQTAMDMVAFANHHYKNFFEREGRPRTVKEYLDCNPDVGYGFYDPKVNTNTDSAKTDLTEFVAKHFRTFVAPTPVAQRTHKTYGCMDLHEYVLCHTDVKTYCTNFAQGDRDPTNKILMCAYNHYRDNGKKEGRNLVNCN